MSAGTIASWPAMKAIKIPLKKSLFKFALLEAIFAIWQYDAGVKISKILRQVYCLTVETNGFNLI